MSVQQNSSPKVVLVGNPNVGKSVVFNALTGAYTTVSNYPGTSVEVSRGHCVIADQRYEILDTPGMYSMMPITEEERVARRILLNEDPHAVIHVIDARNIERMLPMTLQLIEAGLPVILVVNILDEAKRLGMQIDLELLQKNLGIPVIGAVMKRKTGLDELRQAVADYASVPYTPFVYAADLEEDIDGLIKLIHGDYRLSRRATAILLMQKDDDIVQLLEKQESAGDYESLLAAAREISFRRRSDLHLQISLERRKVCKRMLTDVVTQEVNETEPFAEKLSRWMMNPITGTPILLLVVYFGLYKFVGGFGAGTMVDFLEGNIFENYINPPVISFAEKNLSANWLFELLVGEYGLWTLGIRYAVALVLP
ncbi:MAG: ferrous iron transporter B, partial [Desulfuromonadales bacterium]|nr:ferrous iron transporter B [Desulfuromonadales bacterium]